MPRRSKNASILITHASGVMYLGRRQEQTWQDALRGEESYDMHTTLTSNEPRLWNLTCCIVYPQKTIAHLVVDVSQTKMFSDLSCGFMPPVQQFSGECLIHDPNRTDSSVPDMLRSSQCDSQFYTKARTALGLRFRRFSTVFEIPDVHGRCASLAVYIHITFTVQQTVFLSSIIRHCRTVKLASSVPWSIEELSRDGLLRIICSDGALNFPVALLRASPFFRPYLPPRRVTDATPEEQQWIAIGGPHIACVLADFNVSDVSLCLGAQASPDQLTTHLATQSCHGVIRLGHIASVMHIDDALMEIIRILGSRQCGSTFSTLDMSDMDCGECKGDLYMCFLATTKFARDLRIYPLQRLLRYISRFNHSSSCICPTISRDHESFDFDMLSEMSSDASEQDHDIHGWSAVDAHAM